MRASAAKLAQTRSTLSYFTFIQPMQSNLQQSIEMIVTLN